MKKLFEDLAKFFTELVNKIVNFFNERKRYKIYLYLRNQCVKKVYLRLNDEMPTLFIINVYKQGHILGTDRKVKLVVKPVKLKYSDDDKRELHIETKLYEGVDM